MPAGRPTKLTPETEKRFCDGIRLGLTYELASQYAGISYAAFRSWMVKAEGARRSSKFVKFSEAVKKAEGDAVAGWMAKIEKAANDGNWQAAAWKAERRYPKIYGRHYVEHAGEDGGPLRIVFEWSNDDKAIRNGHDSDSEATQ